MKKLVLITGALIALAASSAAGQIHLAVDDCGGPSVLTNACNSNTGQIVMVVSMIFPFTTTVGGFEAVINLAQSSTLSDWMRLDDGGCRNGSLVTNCDFTVTGTACKDVFAGQGACSVLVYYPDWSAVLIPRNSERLDISGSSGTPMAVDEGSECSLFHIVISMAGTVGGPCGGCNTPTSFFLNQVSTPNNLFTGDGSGQSVSYNGGNLSTPAQSKTWGAVKALYR
jgi:hypothetical protein